MSYSSSVDSREDRGLDVKLWTGVLIPPVAGGINTIVGYMVSNYDCNVHNRHLVALVNVISLLLCGTAGMIAASTRNMVGQTKDDPSASLRHSRRFLLHLAYWFSAGFGLFVFAGILSTILLGSCDL